jgi:hypothetical protein
VLAGREVQLTASSARQTLAFALAAQLSAAEGREVDPSELG